MGALVENSGSRSVKRLIALAIGLGLVVIAIYQAVTESMTHDECVTHLVYVFRSYWDIFTWERPWTNSHILNTMFMKLGEDLFGPGELQWRYHSILALVLYLAGIYRLLQKLPVVLFASAFILLSCQTYMLDYFSLARGYGLSLALMVWSLHYLVEYLRAASYKHQVLGLILAVLSFYANFIMLHYLVAYGVIAFILSPRWHYLDRSIWARIKQITLPMILVALAILPLAWPLLSKLVDYKLDFVASGAFWDGTIQNYVLDEFRASWIEPFSLQIRWALQILISISGIMCIGFVAFRHWTKQRLLVTVNLVFWMLIGFAFLTNEYRGTGFPESRMSLHIFFLLSLNTVLMMHFINSRFQLGKWVLAIAALIMSIHFVTNWNHHGLADWKFNRYDKMVILEIRDDIRSTIDSDQTVSVHTQPLYTPVLEFYRRVYRPQGLVFITDVASFDTADYAYVANWDETLLPPAEWELLKAFQPPHVHCLLKRTSRKRE